MAKIMEAVFCAFYLIFTFITGMRIFRGGKGNKQLRLFGIMTLVLVFGDAFHLVPRIIAALNPSGDYSFSLGIGQMITSITMTVFYVILYYIFEMRYEKKNTALRCTILLLALTRIVLCLLPQNDWTGAGPVIWGVYRNIPFTIMGLIMIVLFFREKSDKPFKWAWLAVLLSFAFYIPVVLWSDISPVIGMLMVPKTCMYMWLVVMGYQQVKRLPQGSDRF